MGPNPIWLMSLQEREIWTQSYTREDDMETQGKDSYLQARGTDSPSQPSGGTNPADTWSSDFELPEL